MPIIFFTDTINSANMMRTSLVLILLFVISTASLATNDVRPGLWKITTKSDLLTLVSHIPTQQMQQITRLVKKSGLEMPQIQNGTATSHVCITQQMADQEIPSHFYESQSGCIAKNAIKSGNHYKVDLACTNEYFQGTGVAEGYFTSPEYFTGKTEFDSVIQGTSVFAMAETSGRWINENCTTLQPTPSTFQ